MSWYSFVWLCMGLGNTDHFLCLLPKNLNEFAARRAFLRVSPRFLGKWNSKSHILPNPWAVGPQILPYCPIGPFEPIFSASNTKYPASINARAKMPALPDPARKKPH